MLLPEETVNPRGIMAKELDCHLEVSEFKLQSYNYVYVQVNTLGKSINSLISSAMG